MIIVLVHADVFRFDNMPTPRRSHAADSCQLKAHRLILGS
jgi:hypothetical protein